MKTNARLALATTLAALAACAPVQVRRMDSQEQKDLSGRWNDTDARIVADEMIPDSLGRPWLAAAQQRLARTPTVIVGVVRNQSLEHINTDAVVEALQRALINSGRVAFVASSEERGQLREERRDQDLNASDATRKAHGEEQGADYVPGQRPGPRPGGAPHRGALHEEPLPGGGHRARERRHAGLRGRAPGARAPLRPARRRLRPSPLGDALRGRGPLRRRPDLQGRGRARVRALRPRLPVSGAAVRPEGPGGGGGELVVLHYNGKVPLRGSKSTSVPVGRKKTVREMARSGDDEDQAQLPIALPKIVEQPYAIRGSVVEAAGRSAQTVLVEPLAAITVRALEDELPAIKARAVARAYAKGGAYQAADSAGTSTFVKGAGLSAAGAFEQADTRGWATLPGEIRMARVSLPAGVHDVRIAYRDASGAVAFDETLKGVRITAGYRTYVHVRTAK